MKKILLTLSLLTAFVLFNSEILLAAPPSCIDSSWCPNGYQCVAGVNLPGHSLTVKYCYKNVKQNNQNNPTTTNPLSAPIARTTAGQGSNNCPNEADTALGCIPTEPAELVKWILKYAILMGGGIAFLLSVWGGATILLSAGNPEKINEGRDIIVSAISGLLFIVFSVFLLRLIGVDILGIPGFTSQ